MESKVKSMGHPMHPMLVNFPLGLLVTNLAMEGGPPPFLMILVTATMIVKVPIAQVSHIWSLTVFHLLDFIIKFGDGPACLTSVGGQRSWQQRLTSTFTA
jgi:hypothetical protein